MCLLDTRGGTLADAKGLRVNEQIRAREVRLIDENGQLKGVVSVREALGLAREADLDLVEVAPTAVPPVCKILDFGKYRFEQGKKLKDAKRNQKVAKLKEIRMQPKIGPGDLDTKAKHIQEFLDAGNKVKVTIRFRGRELAHTDLGFGVLKEITNRLQDNYVIDKQPAMEGRFMSMTLNPKAKNKGETQNA